MQSVDFVTGEPPTGGGGVVIRDSSITTTDVWSSSKTSATIAAVAGVTIDDNVTSLGSTWSSSKIVSAGGGGPSGYTGSDGVVLLGSNFSAPQIAVNTAAIAGKANNADVVLKTGNQTIAGTKSFTVETEHVAGAAFFNQDGTTVNARFAPGLPTFNSILDLANCTIQSDTNMQTTANVLGSNILSSNLTNVNLANSHRADVTSNPHAVTQTQVGLGNVDNTSDAAKPISTATQTALNLKQTSSDKNAVGGYCGLDGAGLVPYVRLPATAVYPADPVLGLSQVYSAKTVSDLVASAASGNIIISSVRAKSNVNIPGVYSYTVGTITGTGLMPTVDGVSLIVGDSVLLNDQTDVTYGKRVNGVYRLTSNTTNFLLTRAEYFDDNPLSEVNSGNGFIIMEGLLNAGSTWSLGADTITVPSLSGNLRTSSTTNVGLNNNYLLFYLTGRRAATSVDGTLTVTNNDFTITTTPFASLPVSDIATPAASKVYSAAYTDGRLNDKVSLTLDETVGGVKTFTSDLNVGPLGKFVVDATTGSHGSAGTCSAAVLGAYSGLTTPRVLITASTDTIHGAQSILNLTATTRVQIQGTATNAFSDGEKDKVATITKPNYAATVDPAATDDSSLNYTIGSVWINTATDGCFICVDSTAAASVWKDVSSAGTGGALNNFAAVGPPTNNDDSGDGYSVGSLWLVPFTSKCYIALDVTIGASMWADLTPVGPKHTFDALVEPPLAGNPAITLAGYSNGSLWVVVPTQQCFMLITNLTTYDPFPFWVELTPPKDIVIDTVSGRYGGTNPIMVKGALLPQSSTPAGQRLLGDAANKWEYVWCDILNAGSGVYTGSGVHCNFIDIGGAGTAGGFNLRDAAGNVKCYSSDTISTFFTIFRASTFVCMEPNSVTSPGIRLTTSGAEETTGLYRPALNEIGMTISGVQRMNITSTGCTVTGNVRANGLLPVSPESQTLRLNYTGVGGNGAYETRVGVGRFEGGIYIDGDVLYGPVINFNDDLGAPTLALTTATKSARFYGQVLTSTGSVAFTSDATLKRDINNIDPAVASARICGLRPVTYRFNVDYCAENDRDPDYVWSGFLAHEVFEVYIEQGGVLPTAPVKLGGVDVEKLVLDMGKAHVDLIGAHKHAMTLIEAQQFQINSLIERLMGAGIP